MASKDHSIYLKDNFESAVNDLTDSYNNFTLNKRHNCTTAFDHKSSKSVEIANKKSSHYDVIGKTTSQKDSISLKKSHKILSNDFSKTYFNDAKEKTKAENSSSCNKSSSTLSLHIAAYENSIEVQIADSLADKKLKKKSTITTKLKQQSASFNDRLEFPRQQENDPIKPVVQQFSASQRLFKPLQEPFNNPFVPQPLVSQIPGALTMAEELLTSQPMPGAAELFQNDYGADIPDDLQLSSVYSSLKTKFHYKSVITEESQAKRAKVEEVLKLPKAYNVSVGEASGVGHGGMLALTGSENSVPGASSQALVAASGVGPEDNTVKAMLPSRERMVKPQWHAPWKLYRVLSGHTGWVRCVDVEPENKWFATGGADRMIKIWDLGTGQLRLSLTGHISSVRAVKISSRHPYLFSGGEDKQVKCWDLEYNKVVRHYHGHLSAVQALDLHPTLDILVTSARDSTARVWDMRTKAQIHCLTGHTNTVATVVCQETNPQVITGSHDSTIRLWDLASGRSVCTLTHHKKSIRAIAIHPTLNMFCSASPDSIRQWRCPNGDFSGQLIGHNAVINALAINEDGVTVSGADNGTLHLFDWKSRFCFQKLHEAAQPGSIDSERGIFALTFDKSGTRLISAEADKSIKLFKEDPDATEETHPILWRPEVLKKQRY